MQTLPLIERGMAPAEPVDAATAALASGEFAAVIDQLEPSFRAGDDSAEIMLMLIRAHAGLGRVDERQSLLALALERHPDNLQIRIADAEFAMARQDWKAASERWQRIQTQFARFPSAVYLRHARACLAAQDLDAALRIVDTALEREPDNAAARDLRDVIASRRARKYRIAGQSLAAPSMVSWAPADGQSRIGSLQNFRQCQITLTLDLTQPTTLDVSVGGEAQGSVKLSLEPVTEVIHGEEGWLFLANDANASAEQFTGKRPLDEAQRRRWYEFASSLAVLQQQRSVLFLIANSKEKVSPERYPHRRAAVTPTEEVEAILQQAGADYLNPIEAMQAAPASYYATDTHWSGLGAFIAFQSCLRRLGYVENVEHLFSFSEREVVGDLGSKLDPPARSLTTVVEPQGETRARCRFTNGVPGTGNISIFENEQPLHARTLIIFGGSSAGAGGFARLFAAVFRRVVVFNLPGSYIHEVVEHEQADHVIIQTNERYLPTPGSVRQQLSEMAPEIRRHRLPEAQRNKLWEQIRHQRRYAFYRTFMQEVLR
ncbi:alginate O-acetyltransferase AlgX-related protein [Salinicola aestuarinus]|uniref:alginate O-acetyltransferase AlgX-related protein n=1 Tax=Salinicola aestuarinus TaxID=1949082 RepID=UPI00130065C5|nr:hypothetical protein [Salinicola aestuarinus]